MKLYFAYGMNTNLNSMAQRCPGAVCIGPAELRDYRFSFRLHADVELAYGHRVEGTLWLLDQHHMDALDQCEGYPDYYIRHQVWAYPAPGVVEPDMLEDNGAVKAWVYEMAEKHNETAPSQSYYNHCYEGYEQNGLDTMQLENAVW